MSSGIISHNGSGRKIAGGQTGPFGHRQNARNLVEGNQPLGTLRLPMHGEGDAEPVKH
jgi:hypothetical protein